MQCVKTPTVNHVLTCHYPNHTSCPILHMWNCQHRWEGSGMAHSLYLLLWNQQRGRRSEEMSNKRIGMESWSPWHHIQMAAEPLPKALKLVLKSLTFWIKHIILFPVDDGSLAYQWANLLPSHPCWELHMCRTDRAACMDQLVTGSKDFESRSSFNTSQMTRQSPNMTWRFLLFNCLNNAFKHLL